MEYAQHLSQAGHPPDRGKSHLAAMYHSSYHPVDASKLVSDFGDPGGHVLPAPVSIDPDPVPQFYAEEGPQFPDPTEAKAGLGTGPTSESGYRRTTDE